MAGINYQQLELRGNIRMKKWVRGATLNQYWLTFHREGSESPWLKYYLTGENQHPVKTSLG